MLRTQTTGRRLLTAHDAYPTNLLQNLLFSFYEAHDTFTLAYPLQLFHTGPTYICTGCFTRLRTGLCILLYCSQYPCFHASMSGFSCAGRLACGAFPSMYVYKLLVEESNCQGFLNRTACYTAVTTQSHSRSRINP